MKKIITITFILIMGSLTTKLLAADPVTVTSVNNIPSTTQINTSYTAIYSIKNTTIEDTFPVEQIDVAGDKSFSSRHTANCLNLGPQDTCVYTRDQ